MRPRCVKLPCVQSKQQILAYSFCVLLKWAHKLGKIWENLEAKEKALLITVQKVCASHMEKRLFERFLLKLFEIYLTLSDFF
jgi:hypothetical protein